MFRTVTFTVFIPFSIHWSHATLRNVSTCDVLITWTYFNVFVMLAVALYTILTTFVLFFTKINTRWTRYVHHVNISCTCYASEASISLAVYLVAHSQSNFPFQSLFCVIYYLRMVNVWLVFWNDMSILCFFLFWNNQNANGTLEKSSSLKSEALPSWNVRV